MQIMNPTALAFLSTRSADRHSTRFVRTLRQAPVRACMAALLGLGTLAAAVPVASAQAPGSRVRLVPLPATVELSASETFTIDSGTRVVVAAGAGADVLHVAHSLIAMIGRPQNAEPVQLRAGAAAPEGAIELAIDAGRSALGEEGYELRVNRFGVTLTARTAAGLFYGTQTMRQLMPLSVEYGAALNRGLRIQAAHVVDSPRFEWRGALLDVSRHFLSAHDVKRFIDVMAAYKLNRLHLHLSDDQGWRIEIKSWPRLAEHGGSSAVGGGAGGYYTQAEFRDLVAYATERFITIVPEIDMPGHTNAALSSIPELNCDGVSPPLYFGTRVGFSTVCAGKEEVYKWVDDVVGEIMDMIPTPYFHIGGDEVEKLTHAQYKGFVERVERIARSHGARVIGWGEIAPAKLDPSTIVQHWRADSAQLHVARGGKVIMSASSRMYMDMKYDDSTILGLKWAGLISVRKAYDWDPAKLLANIPERALLGVEAPLWAETLEKRSDYEYMAFPRLLGFAEMGWTPQALRSWSGFRERLAAQGERLSAMGANYYRSAEVGW
jgi:hexosaminidase